MTLVDVPLTELRGALLASLAAGRAVNWASPTLLSWARRAGYVDGYRAGKPDYELTTAGRLALKLDTEHAYSLASRVLGGSPIRGFPDRRGTILRCRCRWTAKTNEAPSEGGRAELKQRHAQHLAEMYAAEMAAEATL